MRCLKDSVKKSRGQKTGIRGLRSPKRTNKNQTTNQERQSLKSYRQKWQEIAYGDKWKEKLQRKGKLLGMSPEVRKHDA